MILLLYIIAYNILFSIFEVCKRKGILSANTTRSIIHIGSALIALTFPLYLPLWQIVVLCGIFFILLIISKYASIFKGIHDAGRKTLGEIYYPIGIAILALAFLPHNIRGYDIAVLVFGISDVAANLIGSHLGKNNFRIFGGEKTIEGTLSFFLSAVIIMLAFGINLGEAVAFSLLTAIAESLSPYGTDNITVPAVIAILLRL